MECTIPARSLRSFSKVLSCMSKIGEELTIEATKSKITLSAVDSARTAFVKCVLLPGFSENYKATSSLLLEGPEKSSLKCRVLIKSLLHIFKGKQLEKTVEKTSLAIGETECRIICQHFCKHGITKTHKVIYEDCERLMNANYSKDSVPNRITLPTKFLGDWLGGFSHGLEEITWMVDEKGLKIQSFTENSASNNLQRLETKFVFSAEEFDYFQVSEKAQMTFSFKEFKAILGAADAFGQSVDVYFSAERGTPILFFISCPDLIEMDFVLATFNPRIPDDDAASEASHSQDSRKSNLSSQNRFQQQHQAHRAAGNHQPNDAFYSPPVQQKSTTTTFQLPARHRTNQPENEMEVDDNVVEGGWKNPKPSSLEEQQQQQQQEDHGSVGAMDIDSIPLRQKRSTDPQRRNEMEGGSEFARSLTPQQSLHQPQEEFMEVVGSQEPGDGRPSTHTFIRSATRQVAPDQSTSGSSPHLQKKTPEGGLAMPRGTLTPRRQPQSQQQQQPQQQPQFATNAPFTAVVPRPPLSSSAATGAQPAKVSPSDISNLRQTLYTDGYRRAQPNTSPPGSFEKRVEHSPSHLQFPFHSPGTFSPPGNPRNQPAYSHHHQHQHQQPQPQIPVHPAIIPLVASPTNPAQRRSPPNHQNLGILASASRTPTSRSVRDQLDEEGRSSSDRIIPTLVTGDEDGDDWEDDFVEGTPPPSKQKFKSLF